MKVLMCGFLLYTRLYTNFSKYISDFIPIFRKCIPDPIPIVKIAKSDTVRYIKFVKIDTVPYAKIMKIDTLLDGTSPYPKCVWYSPPPRAEGPFSIDVIRATFLEYVKQYE